MNKIKAYINGVEVLVDRGTTIYKAAKENNIDNIPTLCFDPRLEPFASCFVCAVEIEGVEKLSPSCSTPLEENMKVQTKSDKVLKARKTALELLLSNHYADCVAPCQETCPAKVDVQGYIALISAGKYSEAVRLIKETNPLPLVCGRVCVRTCELSCRRDIVDESVGIDYLKRYATDIDIQSPWTPDVPPFNSNKVALIGGGPASLTCAYYLRLKGYECTIFEQMPFLGGMLRFGIPEYRLPKEELDKEINWILNLGVKVELNKKLGEDFTIKSLRESGFDSIFIGLGAWKAKPMRLPDEFDTEGVLSGIDFLRTIPLGSAPDFTGKTVIVVGGGNTAIDAARSAVRLKAEQVYIVYRRTRKEMPAHEAEISAAEHEGVKIVYLAAPTRIISKEKKVTGLESLKMELGAPDASGRRSPVPVEGSEYVINCDYIISAIGQDVDAKGIVEDDGVKMSRWNTPTADDRILQTTAPDVFIGGDAYLGAATAIEAIAHGKIAANSIDEYLSKGVVEKKNARFLSKKDVFQKPIEKDFNYIPKSKRELMPELDAKYRIQNQEEVELGYTQEQAATEAFRCLECGCSDYFYCNLRKYSDEYSASQNRFVGEFAKCKEDLSHPFIALDSNKCISCGLCVRTCGDNLKISALGFVGRGLRTTVKPALDKALLETTCVSCGNCIDVCPTGAIYEKKGYKKPGPFEIQINDSICRFCSLGCSLKVEETVSGLYSVIGGDNIVPNDGYLCYKGRFGHRAGLSEQRLKSSYIACESVEIKEALNKAVSIIKENIELGKSIQIFASAKLGLETLILLKQLTQSLSAKIACADESANCAEIAQYNSKYGSLFSSAKLADLSAFEQIILIGDASKGSFVLEYDLAKAQKNGAKLISLLSAGDRKLNFCNEYFDYADNSKLANEIQELSKDKSSVIVYNPDNSPKNALDIIKNIENENSNFKTLIVRNNANSLGLQTLEIFPQDISKTSPECIIAIGEDVLKLAELKDFKGKIIALDYLKTETIAKADVAIAIPAPIEDKGVYVSFDGSVNIANSGAKSENCADAYSIINTLSLALFPDEKHYHYEYAKSSAIETAKAKLAQAPKTQYESVANFDFSIPQTRINIDSSEIYLENEITSKLFSKA